MTISFKLSRFDIYYFNIHVLFLSKFNLIILFILCVLVGHASVKNIAPLEVDLLVSVITVSITILGYVLFIVLFLLVLIALWVFFYHSERSDKGLTAMHFISLNENYFIEETKYNKSEINWSGIHKVEKTNKYIFIYESPMRGHIIPKRVFVSNEDYLRFFTEAQEYFKESRKLIKHDAVT